MRFTPACFALALVAASPAATAAQTRQVTVTFPPGATATTLRASLRGDGQIAYAIEARAGQTMQLLLAPSNRSCTFNLYEPGAGAATHIGAVSGNEFGSTLGKDGRYRVEIGLLRAAARRQERCRFRLSVEITGAPGGVSAGLSDRMMVDACRANAAPMYGVSGAAIRLPGRIRPDGQGGFRLDGTVDKGAEGVKKLRCLYRADRRFSHVMAMTPDGE